MKYGAKRGTHGDNNVFAHWEWAEPKWKEAECEAEKEKQRSSCQAHCQEPAQVVQGEAQEWLESIIINSILL